MKIKLSTHTFLVQISKLKTYFDRGIRAQSDVVTIWSMLDILETLPNIDKADYSEIAEYYRRRTLTPSGVNWSDFKIYTNRFLRFNPPGITERLLLSMLEVVPDGEILLELGEEEILLLNISKDLSAARLDVSTAQAGILYDDPNYNTFEVAEE